MSSNVAVASKELNFASKREQAISASSSLLKSQPQMGLLSPWVKLLTLSCHQVWSEGVT